MGNYEHVEMTATVEINTETDTEILALHGVDVTSLGDVHDFIDEQLQIALESDVEDAHYNTAEEDSFIHEYHQETKKRK